jgi:hypothetical protein
MTVDHKFVEIPNVKNSQYRYSSISPEKTTTRTRPSTINYATFFRILKSIIHNAIPQNQRHNVRTICSLNWRYTQRLYLRTQRKKTRIRPTLRVVCGIPETSNIHRQTLSTGKQHKPTVRPWNDVKHLCLYIKDTPQHKISN